MPDVARDFDTETMRTARLKPPVERSFRVAGRVFTHRVAVAPEALSEFRSFDNAQGDVVLAEVLDLTMSRVLEPDSAALWTEARKTAAENPITLLDMLDICVWVVAQISARPTVPSDESSTSSTPSGTSSTETSDSAPAGDSWD